VNVIEGFVSVRKILSVGNKLTLILIFFNIFLRNSYMILILA